MLDDLRLSALMGTDAPRCKHVLRRGGGSADACPGRSSAQELGLWE